MVTVKHVVLFFVLGLSACANEPVLSPPKQAAPVPQMPIVTVDAERLSDYWIIDDAPVVLDGALTGRSVTYGCVAVNFGIDRDGQMFDMRVMKSFPQDRFSDYAKQAMTQFEFEEAQGNPVKQPVRTQWILGIAEVDGRIALHKAENIVRYCQ